MIIPDTLQSSDSFTQCLYIHVQIISRLLFQWLTLYWLIDALPNTSYLEFSEVMVLVGLGYSVELSTYYLSNFTLQYTDINGDNISYPIMNDASECMYLLYYCVLVVV